MAGTKNDRIDGKTMVELIPPSLDEAVGAVLTFGAKKYAPRNWEKGIEWSRIYGSLKRHMNAWYAGQDNDPETGMSHLWHAACNITFLIEFLKTHPELDDRPHIQNKKALEAVKPQEPVDAEFVSSVADPLRQARRVRLPFFPFSVTITDTAVRDGFLVQSTRNDGEWPVVQGDGDDGSLALPPARDEATFVPEE